MEPEPMEEDTKVDYTEDFKSLVLEASLSNSLMETAERFKVSPEMLVEWQRQEGIDCVLDPSLSMMSQSPAPSTSATVTPLTSASIPVPQFKTDNVKVEPVKVKSEVGAESSQTTPVNRVYTKEVINQVLNYLEDHTVTEASKLFQIPHSTVFGWARKQRAPPETQDSPELAEIKRKVLEYAETHTPAEVKAKFDIPTSTLYRWRRDKKALMLTLDENDNLDKKLPPRSIIRTNVKASPSGTVKTEDWSTKDKIVEYAKRSKNYQVTARKFGVSSDDIKKWAKALRDEKKLNKTVKAAEPPKKRPRGRPRKVPLPPVESEEEIDDDIDEERFGTTLYEGENLDEVDDKNLDEGDEEDDDDEEEEEEDAEIDEEDDDSDDEPEFDVKGIYKSSGGKRVKEFPQRIKAEAVRWATYEDPKSPWKLRVIIEARQIGVKEAAKKFKVAQITLEDWIDTSGKYCEELLQVKREMDFNDTDGDDQGMMDGSDIEDGEDRERCDVCQKKLSRDETMLEHLASNHLDEDGNCDVCGVGVEDFERHFRLHMVRVEEPGPGETELVDEEDKKVSSDDISDQDVQDLLKDLLVDV